MKKTAFITGATSGIGMATAKLFAQHNIDLVLCGRRQDRLDSLKMELASNVDVHTLTFDVRDKETVFSAIESKEVYPKGNVYCASKFAVDALNNAMRIDLNEHGIRVGAVNPGLVETEFSEVRFKGDTDRAAGVYSPLDALQADDIADIIHFVVTRPYHVNIADLVVVPTAQASAYVINKR